MTTRTFVDKNGNEWSWEETSETQKQLKKLQKIGTEALNELHKVVNDSDISSKVK